MKFTEDLRSLNDAALLENTKNLVREERGVLTTILRYLNEVDRRKLFSDLGYRSLFDYAVRGLGYSEAQASRRIQAMRLIRQIPQVEGKIQNGQLSLSNISNAQTFFQQQERASKARVPNETPYRADQGRPNSTAQGSDSIPSGESDGRTSGASPTLEKAKRTGGFSQEEKLHVLGQLENKTSREGERLLLSLHPELTMARERLRPVSACETELRLVLKNDQIEKLHDVRGLLGPQASSLTWSELIAKMADICLESLQAERCGGRQRDSLRTDARRSANTSEASNCTVDVGNGAALVVTEDLTSVEKVATNLVDQSRSGSARGSSSLAARSTPAPAKRSVENGTSSVIVGDVDNPLGPVGRPSGTRHVPRAARRLVWARDGGRCTKCGTTRNLTIDHRVPVALGGTSDIENLRLLCFNCNQREAIKIFGVEACLNERDRQEYLRPNANGQHDDAKFRDSPS